MWDVVGSTLGLLVIFTLIGIGPALLLFKRSTAFAIACAPTIGVILTTLAGTYLVAYDHPIINWGMNWLFVSLVLSALSVLFHCKQSHPMQSTQSIAPFFVGFFICCVFVLTPIIVGGLKFTLFRGNGVDSFNYMIMAGSLTHEPLSWINTATTDQLIAKNPLYSIATILLKNTRWSTSLLMGWCALITKMPLYRLEYGFTALFMLLTYGCAYSFATLLEIKPRYVLLVALALCIGFWGQFVLDIRAMSQISTLPILLFFVLLIADTNKNKASSLFLGLSIASIALLYTELLPTIALGLLLFFSLALLHKRESVKNLIHQYSLAFLIAVIALLPLFLYVLTILASQLKFAYSAKNTWEIAYFHWLYKKTALGFWGFSIINQSNQAAFDLILSSLKPIIHFLSLVLTGLFLYQIVTHFFAKKPNLACSLSVAFFMATLIESACLYFHAQYWAAGKTISFGFPFLFFIVASLFQRATHNRLLSVCKYTVLTWLVIQCGLGGYRIFAAKQHLLYSNYISHHALYQTHNWELSNIANAVKTRHITQLGLNVPDAWMTEYLNLAFGWDSTIQNFNALSDRTAATARHLSGIPDYFIIASNNPLASSEPLIAKNHGFVLIKTSPALLKQLQNHG